MSTQDYEPGEHYPGAEDPYAPLPPLPEPPRRPSLLLKTLTWRDVVLVLLGLAVMRLFVVETAIVEGRSMSPTLRSEEWVLVLRPLHPHRFSVIVFTDPQVQVPAVKRVVGLPGDTVGSVVVRPPVAPGAPPESRLEVNGVTYSEPYAPVTLGSIRGVQLADDQYYVLGDNREDSVDSRRYDPIRASSIRGVAVAVVYPFSRMRTLSPSAEPISDPQAGAAH